MARTVRVIWRTDDGDRFVLRKDMENEELVSLMRLLENDLEFEEDDFSKEEV